MDQPPGVYGKDFKHVSGVPSSAATTPAHENSSPPARGRGSATTSITALDVQIAWSRNEPDETLTMSDLLRGALHAKQRGDDKRALLLLGQVNRRLRECQRDAERELGL